MRQHDKVTGRFLGDREVGQQVPTYPNIIARFKDHPARLAAIEAGLNRFDPGEPCKRGHVSPRYVVGQHPCVACVKFNNWRDGQRR
jgi:hypothetical protein